ncbi:16S rRNA (guanine(966)-N(2))-methyltransferase RsmD [bacterium]|nr:16S rRNA (guanine(966)-N(2))-methyltransferase RsmD [bacterium]
MRICAGKYKGRKLSFGDTFDHIRPTKDRVKESIFNMLADKCEGAICLDLFAGSGALGLEALSRGASHVDFVDIDTRLVHKNSAFLSAENGHSIHKKAFDTYLKSCSRQYDLVFLDPPWDMPLAYEMSLKALIEFDILKSNAYIICEHTQTKVTQLNFEEVKYKRFGRTLVTLLKEKKHE